MASSELWQEPVEKLKSKTMDISRAIKSLMEELEAVALYQQRADATEDESLKKILLHNGNEEKEHASMLLEWIRRNDDIMSEQLKTYLFTTAPDITATEEKMQSGKGGTPERTVGSLKEEKL